MTQESKYKHISIPLKTLIDQGRSGQLVLPALQRPFVWEPEQIARFWDTLLRGWPFGSLLLWETALSADANFPCRPFGQNFTQGRDDDGYQASKFYPNGPALPQIRVLDGQQRIQSLLLGFDSEGHLTLPSSEWEEKTPELPQNERDGEKRHLYLNTTAFNAADAADADEDAPKVVWLHLSQKTPQHRRLSDVLKSPDSIGKEGLLRHSLDRALETQVFVTQISNTKATDIVSIFARLNTAGTVLTKEQIHSAILCQKWAGAPEAIRRLQEELQTDAKTVKPRWSLPLGYDDLVAGFDIALQCRHAPDAQHGMSTIYDNAAPATDLITKEQQLATEFESYTASLKTVAEALREKGAVYGGLYSSLHSLWLLVALHYGAKKMSWNMEATKLTLTGQEGLRWILLSQWAKVWASSSGGTIKAYKNAAHRILTQGGEVGLSRGLITQANTFAEKAKINVINLADSPATARGSVSRYHSILWAWQRLTQNRLNQTASLSTTFDRKWSVDHAIAFKTLGDNNVDARNRNHLGNCLLVPHDFNISKADNTWSDTIEQSGAAVSSLLCTDLFNGVIGGYLDAAKCRGAAIRDDVVGWIYGNSEAIKLLVSPTGVIESITEKNIPDGSSFSKWLNSAVGISERPQKPDAYTKKAAQSYLSMARSAYRSLQLTPASLAAMSAPGDFKNGNSAWKQYGQFRSLKVNPEFANRYPADEIGARGAPDSVQPQAVGGTVAGVNVGMPNGRRNQGRENSKPALLTESLQVMIDKEIEADLQLDLNGVVKRISTVTSGGRYGKRTLISVSSPANTGWSCERFSIGESLVYLHIPISWHGEWGRFVAAFSADYPNTDGGLITRLGESV